MTNESVDRYASIIKALNRGQTVEVMAHDAVYIRKWFGKYGIRVKIFNEFKTSPFRKIKKL
jgi:ABC-type uncharacterized transport system ATPase subunit